MGQVNITLNGRTYNLECDDGEEDHLIRLAGQMSENLQTLRGRFGQVGDDRLLLMAGLMFADELAETRKRLEDLQGKLAEIGRDRAAADEQIGMAQAEVAERIAAAADRIQALNAQLNGRPAAVEQE
ncbi:MAG: cell division protein ZapA [Methyloligellaceae bacterium]